VVTFWCSGLLFTDFHEKRGRTPAQVSTKPKSYVNTLIRAAHVPSDQRRDAVPPNSVSA